MLRHKTRPVWIEGERVRMIEMGGGGAERMTT